MINVAGYKKDKTIESTYLDVTSHKFKSYIIRNNYFLIEEQAQELSFKMGDDVFFIPKKFKGLIVCLEKAKKILDLKYDWDERGSEGFTKETLFVVAKFLLQYAKEIDAKLDYLIDFPRIYPSANGSIDIDWETETYGLLINISKEGKTATYYGDDKASQMTEGVFNPINFNINLLPRAISF